MCALCTQDIESSFTFHSKYETLHADEIDNDSFYICDVCDHTCILGYQDADANPMLEFEEWHLLKCLENKLINEVCLGNRIADTEREE